MGTDRTWTIRKDMPSSSMPFDSAHASILGPNTDNVFVVEESRLREAEAELARLEAENREYQVRVTTAEADAESAFEQRDRAEAELREALAFYADEENHAVQIRFAPVTGERYGAPSLVAEDRGDRARGVLEKDTGG